MAVNAVLINRKIAISRARFEVKLEREVALLQYGGLLFHSAGTGFVRYYTVSHKNGANLFLPVTS